MMKTSGVPDKEVCVRMCEGRIVTDEQLAFAIFCIEAIAEQQRQDPRDVYDVLANKTDLLGSYIVRHYDVLHTQDKRYIVDDILRVLGKEATL